MTLATRTRLWQIGRYARRVRTKTVHSCGGRRSDWARHLCKPLLLAARHGDAAADAAAVYTGWRQCVQNLTERSSPVFV